MSVVPMRSSGIRIHVTRQRPGDSEDATTYDPGTARLRTVLDLIAQGRTQSEIAAHFGRDVRTIRRWTKLAREAQVKAFRTRTPDTLIAEVEHDHRRSAARWCSVMERARLAGDLKAEMDAMAKLDDLNDKRARRLQQLGFFDNLAIPRAARDIRRELLGDLAPEEPIPPDDGSEII